MNARIPSISIILAGFLLVGCEYELDTGRNPEPRGTFGEEIHRIIVKDLDRYQPAKGQSFGAERERFVRSVDSLAPGDLLDPLQAFLVESLPLYDDGRMQNVLRPLACTLRQELARDHELHDAVWYLRRPEGYGPDQVMMPLVRRLANRDDFDDLIEDLAGLWLAHDGLDSGFRPSEENATFTELLSDLSIWLAGREQEQTDPESSWAVLRDWLLSEDPRLADGQTEPQWVVRTCQRGRAMVAPDPITGRIPDPFVDLDDDGLADLDPASGDYLGANDQVLDAAPPFDAWGERPRTDGRLIYRYGDLSLSPLAALLLQIEPLVADGILWDLPDALPALLGPLTPLDDEDGLYAGYEPSKSPAVAVLHALVVLADYDRLSQLLESVLTIAELHEPQLARLLSEVEKVGDVVDLYPEVELRDHNRLLDDTLPHLLQISRRGYLLPVLESFGDPRWRRLQPGLAEMIRYRSVVPSGWDYYDDYDTYDHYLQVRQLTDFSAPDTVYENRSNLQRGIHLIHDADGIEHRTSILGIELPFVIEDMLGFFLDSTAGLAEVPGWAVPFILEFSSTNPTTEEVNRFMTNNHTNLGNPVGREGFELRQYNAEALMALEFTGALDGLRPMWSTLVALDRNLQPSGTRVLAGLLASTHPHYSCNLPNASEACAHVRPLEPMLLEILDTTSVLDAVVDLMASLQGRLTPSGHSVLGELDRFAAHLLEPDGSITRHDGSTSVAGGDGVTPVFPISRLYLLLDALRVIDDAVDAEPKAKDAFERAGDLMYDRFLQVEQADGSWRFANRPAWILLLDLLDLLSERAEKLVYEGTLSSRLATIETDFRNEVSGRVLPRVVTAWNLVAGHSDLPARIDAVALDLLDHDDPINARELRRLAVWAMQHLQVDRVTVPVGRTLGRRIDPQSAGWRSEPGVGCVVIPPEYEELVNLRFVSRALDLVLALLNIRGQGRPVLSELLTNATTFYPGTDLYPLDDVLEVISNVHRADPLRTDELKPVDMANILDQIGEYLLDEERGLEKLYVMIDRRDGF